jgi:hypothetical protein
MRQALWKPDHLAAAGELGRRFAKRHITKYLHCNGFPFWPVEEVEADQMVSSQQEQDVSFMISSDGVLAIVELDERDHLAGRCVQHKIIDEVPDEWPPSDGYVIEERAQSDFGLYLKAWEGVLEQPDEFDLEPGHEAASWNTRGGSPPSL